jgi:hypothetical protein
MRTLYGGTIGIPFDSNDRTTNATGRAEEAFVKSLYPGMTDAEILTAMKVDIGFDVTGDRFFYWATSPGFKVDEDRSKKDSRSKLLKRELIKQKTGKCIIPPMAILIKMDHQLSDLAS